MGKTILVVDDDPLVLRSIKNLLEREKYALEIAKSTQEAREKVKQKIPDLIICDIRMPGEDGISFVKGLRENSDSALANIPTIFVTGYASEEAPIDAIKLGVKDYLLKPFDLEELIASVRKQLG